MTAALAITSWPRRRVGRPSLAAPFRQLVTDMLLARPGMPTTEILEDAKSKGFAGGKSALYAMVADVRRANAIPAPAATAKQERAWRLLTREQRKAELVAALERRQQEDRQIRQRRDGHRQQMRETRDRAALEALQERLVNKRVKSDAELPFPLFRPLAEDEESTRLRVLVRKWLADRRATHKSVASDYSRWYAAVSETFGDLEPGDVDGDKIRAFIEAKLATGLSSTTVRHYLALLSTIFSDLVARKIVAANPVMMLPRAVKRLCRLAHDPRDTPFLENMDDIRRLREALREPQKTMFSVAVMSGLRPGELVALEWRDIRADFRLMHVTRRWKDGRIDTPKSGHGRVVPISPALGNMLREWRAQTGDGGLLFKSKRARYIDPFRKAFRWEWYEALKRAGIPPIRWYQATRHTFSSQWVMAGQSIERLSTILGHSSIMVTQIYAHLKPESMTIPDVIDFGQKGGL